MTSDTGGAVLVDGDVFVDAAVVVGDAVLGDVGDAVAVPGVVVAVVEDGFEAPELDLADDGC